MVTNDYTCALCHSGAWEDWQHLFFGCQFSQRVWNYMQIQWSIGVDLKQWSIFEGTRPSFRTWKRDFIEDISLLQHRFKPPFLL
ncbi:hypothetical protein BRADI_5g07865v3 [Brachypodium distachyon]|uniref:Reverse transcriptase zinc-binding domain-containing protein n=1 Tax=Brachypodium distachyon TaxID=15368 RepID=A0A2K2CFW4_BRADI|nr:hypothetical protein BRADI_5g07865v3 [Brachypodium distachyon]